MSQTMNSDMPVRLAMLALLLAVADLGCGYCDGAIRRIRAQRAERAPPGGGGCKKAGRGQGQGMQRDRVVRVAAGETFEIRADGPKGSSEELLRLSGIGPSSWILLDDRSQQAVPAEILAGSGGHVCLRGVHFSLRPRAPLRPGNYTLVLYLDRVRWRVVHPERRVTHRGRPALVRRFVVR